MPARQGGGHNKPVRRVFMKVGQSSRPNADPAVHGNLNQTLTYKTTTPTFDFGLKIEASLVLQLRQFPE